MAKKDTYLALLRRGIDETTSQLLSESGLKIGDLKKLDEEKLVSNYGIKKEIAKSVIESVKSGPRASSRQRFIADVITKGAPKKVDRIQEQRFKREQKDLLQQLNEKREEQRVARVESFRNKKLVNLGFRQETEMSFIARGICVSIFVCHQEAFTPFVFSQGPSCLGAGPMAAPSITISFAGPTTVTILPPFSKWMTH